MEQDLEWADVLPSLEQIDTIDELEAVASDPEAFVTNALLKLVEGKGTDAVDGISWLGKEPPANIEPESFMPIAPAQPGRQPQPPTTNPPTLGRKAFVTRSTRRHDGLSHTSELSAIRPSNQAMVRQSASEAANNHCCRSTCATKLQELQRTRWGSVKRKARNGATTSKPSSPSIASRLQVRMNQIRDTHGAK